MFYDALAQSVPAVVTEKHHLSVGSLVLGICLLAIICLATLSPCIPCRCRRRSRGQFGYDDDEEEFAPGRYLYTVEPSSPTTPRSRRNTQTLHRDLPRSSLRNAVNAIERDAAWATVAPTGAWLSSGAAAVAAPAADAAQTRYQVPVADGTGAHSTDGLPEYMTMPPTSPLRASENGSSFHASS